MLEIIIFIKASKALIKGKNDTKDMILLGQGLGQKVKVSAEKPNALLISVGS